MATLVTPTDKTTEKAEKKSPPVPDEKQERKQRPRVDEKFKIFSGTANEPLADEVWDPLESTCRHASLSIL